jgi:hypothetical protein
LLERERDREREREREEIVKKTMNVEMGRGTEDKRKILMQREGKSKKIIMEKRAKKREIDKIGGEQRMGGGEKDKKAYI